MAAEISAGEETEKSFAAQVDPTAAMQRSGTQKRHRALIKCTLLRI
jgi:hypothetical protein